MSPEAGETHPENLRPERVLYGLGVSSGLVLGHAHLCAVERLPVPEYGISVVDVPAELKRFDAAVDASRRQLAKLKDKARALHGAAGTEVALLLDAHLAMLGQSRLLRGVIRRIEAELVNAETALDREMSILAESFASVDDSFLASRVDEFRVVSARLLRNLTKTPFAPIGKLPPGTVLLADDLTPADTALMDPSRIAGFACVLGGPESHTAIMARAMGIPAVLGCVGLLHGIDPGDPVLIDGFTGTVVINPSAETLAEVQARQAVLAREQRQLRLIRDLPSVTEDGIEMTLQANVSLERNDASDEADSHWWELDSAIENGAMGVGLLRTEFLFMNREVPPDEAEQLALLSTLVRRMDGRPVTIRTVDIGGDKLASSLKSLTGDSDNPALGLRAIRLALRHPDLLETQYAAILRASLLGPVRILLPMISSLDEVRHARAILVQVRDKLAARGIEIPALPPLGIMIEIPGTALAADAFAHETDFFSIGTNDLTQYTLAIDRGDEQVAPLYNPLHPGVLRLIQFAAEAARRAGIPVGVCGEMAGDPKLAAFFLGLGIRDLSMTPNCILPVKQRVRAITEDRSRTLAAAVMRETETQAIVRLLEGRSAD